MEGLLCRTDLFMIASAADLIGGTTTSMGTFVLRASSIASFVENCGSADKESLAFLDIEQRRSCRSLISLSHFTVLQKVTRLSAKRTNSNAPATSVYTPILPLELFKLSPRQFKPHTKIVTRTSSLNAQF